MHKQERKIVVAITGASGAVYAEKLLGKLSANEDIKALAVVLSNNAGEIWEYETGIPFTVADKVKEYKNNNLYAPFASGSSDYDTMIICPASMGMVGRIASGVSDDLITRAADVMLKERRRLIIVPRETPYSLIHIKNMETLTLAGAIVCPATPSFYSKPATIDDLVMTVVERIIDLAGLNSGGYRFMDND